MYRDKKIRRIISIITLVTFLFTNSLQAAPVNVFTQKDTSDIYYLATNATGDQIDSPSDLTAEEVERIAVLAFLRRERARLANQSLPNGTLAETLSASALEWCQARSTSTVTPDIIASLIEDMLGEQMDFRPVSADVATAEVTEPAQVTDVFLPIRTATVVRPSETVTELRITGITFVGEGDQTISRIFSNDEGEPIAIVILEDDATAAADMVDLYNRSDAGEQLSELQNQTLDNLFAPYMLLSPEQLIEGLKSTGTIPGTGLAATPAFILAALNLKGATMFCATRSDIIVPRRFQLGINASPVHVSHVKPVLDLARQAGLKSLIDSPKPVYVIYEITQEDGQFIAHYRKFEEGVPSDMQTREIPEGELSTQARAYLDTTAVFAAEQAEVSTIENTKERRAKAKEVSGKLQELKEHKDQWFSRLGRNLFAEELAGGAAECRPNFLGTYLIGANNHMDISGYFDLAWTMKERIGNFENIYRNPAEQQALRTLLKRLHTRIGEERAAFRELQDRVKQANMGVPFAELEIYRERLRKLVDLAWVIEHDILENIGRIKDLAENLGLDPKGLSPVLLEEMRSLNNSLNAIDGRLETRGRDSLGFQYAVTFEDAEGFKSFVKALGEDGKELTRELGSRKKIPNLGNGSIETQFSYNGDGKVNKKGPVTVTFTYKTALLIGRLGDNVAKIKENIFDDRILKTLLQKDMLPAVSTKILHTRWASAGIVSEENCHSVNNVGVYVDTVDIAHKSYESVWKIDSDKLYSGYGRMGHINVILNGDIENYNREALSGLRVSPNLDEEYERAAEGRKISPAITTDAKRIPPRIEYFLSKGHNLEEAIRRACAEFEGSFAIQVFSDLEPDKVFIAKGGSGQGLYIGLSDSGYHPASEPYGFIEETQRYVDVPAGEVIVLNKNTKPLASNIKRANFEALRLAEVVNSLNMPLLSGLGIGTVDELKAHLRRKEAVESNGYTQTVVDRVFTELNAQPADAVNDSVLEALARINIVRDAFSDDDVQVSPQTSRDIYLDTAKYTHFLDQELSKSPAMWETTIMGRFERKRTTTDDGEKIIPDIKLENTELPKEILDKIRSGKIKRIWLTGMGTAENAGHAIATVMQGYLTKIAQKGGHSISVEAKTATDLGAEVPADADLSDTLVIGISQSGTTADTNTFLARAAGCGASLLGIINKRETEGVHVIQGAGGGVLYTGSGRDIEISVASTMAYYAQIAAGSMYAMKIAQALSGTDRPLEVFLRNENRDTIAQSGVPSTVAGFLEHLEKNAFSNDYSVDSILDILFSVAYPDSWESARGEFRNWVSERSATRVALQAQVKKLQDDAQPVPSKLTQQLSQLVTPENALEALFMYCESNPDAADLQTLITEDMSDAILAKFKEESASSNFDLNEELLTDINEMEELPNKMRKFLETVRTNKDHPLHAVAKTWPLMRANWKILGVGTNFAGAREVRIKASELCYMTIPVDSLENFKHIDFSAEPWALILLANAKGENDFILQNAPPEVDKILAHNIPVTIVTTAKQAKQFKDKKCRVVDRKGQMQEIPVQIIEVPETREKFATVLSTMAGHKLSYETAKNMDEIRAGAVSRIIDVATRAERERGAAIREKLIATDVPGTELDKSVSKALLKDPQFLHSTREALAEMKKLIAEGLFNTEFTSADTSLFDDYYYIFDMAVRFPEQHTISFHLADFGLNGTDEAGFLNEFNLILEHWRSRLMRTIDSVRHQAKTVTVGIRQLPFTPEEAEAILERVERVEYYDKSAFLRGYDNFTRTKGGSQIEVLPYMHETTKDGADLTGKVTTSIDITVKNRSGLLHDLTEYFAANGINVSEITQLPTYKKDDSSPEIAFIRLIIDKPVEETPGMHDPQTNKTGLKNILLARLDQGATQAAYALTAEARGELQQLGMGDEAVEEVARRTARAERGEIIARKSFLNLLSEMEGVSLREIVRRIQFHERIHNILELDPAIDKEALVTRVNDVLSPEFRDRFASEFGEFDAEEVLAQYYSSKFENRKNGFFDDVAPAIEGVMQADFASVHNLFNVNIPEGAPQEQISEMQTRKRIRVSQRAKQLGAKSKITREQSTEEIEKEVKLARFKTRPSGFVSRGVPAVAAMRLNEVRSELDMQLQENQERVEELERLQEVNRQRIEHWKSRGVTIEGDENNIFIGEDVHIEKGAVIRAGAVVTGNTLIGANAVIEGVVHDSYIARMACVINGGEVINSLIRESARIDGATVRVAEIGENSQLIDICVETKDYNPRDPEEWQYDERHKVREHQTVIGKNCTIHNQAYIKNTTIGDGTTIEGGSYNACEIGRNNTLHRLKANLLHTEFDVIIDPKYKGKKLAVAEIQERWIGYGYRHYGAELYAEGYAGNVLATPRGAYHFFQGSPEGHHVVYSSFDGTGATNGGEYVGRLRDRAMSSSAHKHFKLRPGAWVGGSLDPQSSRHGGRINMVGLPGNPDVLDFTAVNATDILPGSVIGPEPWVNVWGNVLGKRDGQSWANEEAAYVLFNAPNLFAGGIMAALKYDAANRDRIIESLGERKAALRKQGFTDEELRHLDYKDLNDVVPAILEARIALIDKLISTGLEGVVMPTAQGKAIGVNGVHAAKLKQARDTYDLHLTTDLGKELWQIEEGELKHWKWNEGQRAWEPKNPADFQRFVDVGLVANPMYHAWPNANTFYPEYTDSADRDPYRPSSIYPMEKDMLESVSVDEKRSGDIPAKFLALKNVEIDPSAQIEDTVEIEEGTPDRPTKIGAGTVLKGNTKVKAGARLYRTRAFNATFGEEGEFDLVSAVAKGEGRIIFEAGCKYNNSRVASIAGHSVNIGKGSRGDHTTVKADKQDIVIGEKATLFANARIVNSNIGPKSRIGCKVVDSNLGTGFTAQHAATRIYNTDAPDRDTANYATVAAGAIVGKKVRDSKRVTLEPGSFVTSNKVVSEGVRVGELSFIAGHVPGGQSLPPFTLFQGVGSPDALRSGTRPAVQLAGVLSNKHLGMSYYRMMFGYPAQFAATDEQREAVNLRVEDRIVKLAKYLSTALTKKHGTGDEKIAVGDVKNTLDKALAFIRSDLAGEGVSDRDERISQRQALFSAVLEAIRDAKSGFPQKVAFVELLKSLEVACEWLSDGRTRMREGHLTDVVLHNESKEKNDPNFKVISLTSSNIDRAVSTVKKLRRGPLTRSDANVSRFRVTMGTLRTAKSDDQIGLTIAARTIMENIGTVEVLRDLAQQRTREGGPAFRIIVYTRDEKEQRMIEQLEFPGVEVISFEPQVGDVAVMNALVENMNGTGIRNEHIGMIARPSTNTEATIAQLRNMAPEVYIGVPQAPQQDQLLSMHGIFRDVIDAIAKRKQEKVFAISLPPIENPSAELRQSFKEYREAIEFLKNA